MAVGSAFRRRSGGGGGAGLLDTQTVTAGGSGTALNQDRNRGYSSGSIGSITDGTSNIYSGAAITDAYWDENLGSPNSQLIVLKITGATNTGWTTLTIKNGATTTATLTRASASFTAGGTWIWSFAAGTYTPANNPFGSATEVRTLEFS